MSKVETRILDNNGYELFVRCSPVAVPRGLIHVQFYSLYDKAKEPKTEQVRFEMFLTAGQMDILRSGLIKTIA
jgi:hypothetical protein